MASMNGRPGQFSGLPGQVPGLASAASVGTGIAPKPAAAPIVDPPSRAGDAARPAAERTTAAAVHAKAGGAGTSPEPKRVFTTGEAADICKVSQQTIIRCFDAGRLGGFRVPGSKFRRIPRGDLLKFMKANAIPLENLAAFEGLRGNDTDSTKRVLVVDDDPAILDLFKDLFSKDQRFTIKVCGTGYEAGLLTESFRPHLMILDFMLPDVNGNVVCERIRQHEQLSATRVLFVSGVVSQGEIERLSAAGGDGFIAKPFDLAALMRRVEHLLDLAKVA